MSKLSKESAQKTMKDEIIKCWDDGELAKYDQLLKLIPIAGPNIVTDVFYLFVFYISINGVL